MAYDEVTAQLVRENEKLRAVCADILSVRDQFAKAALQGLCANSGGPFQANGMNGWGVVNTTFDGIAADAYALADAMMRARAVTPTQPTKEGESR